MPLLDAYSDITLILPGLGWCTAMPVRSLRVVCVKMPVLYISMLDDLVKEGRFSSRSEAVRVAIRELLQKELGPAGSKQDKPKIVRLDS